MATNSFENTADLRALMEAKLWGGDPALAGRGEYGRLRQRDFQSG